jgi:hypothetical protein
MSKLLSEEDWLRCSDEAVVTLSVHRTNITTTFTAANGFCLRGNASIATRDDILLRKCVQNATLVAGKDGPRDTGWGGSSGLGPTVEWLARPRAAQALHQKTRPHAL